MIMSKYLAIIALCCCIGRAQTAVVTPLGPDGGIVTLLEGSLLDDVVFAVVNSNRLYRSVDGGLSWNSIVLPVSQFGQQFSIRDIEIHPVNPDAIFLATTHGLLHSTNRGMTWTLRQSTPFPSTGIRYSPANFSILIGSDNEGVLLSSDGGTTWMPLKDNQYFGNRRVRMVAVHPADNNPAAMRIIATTGFDDTTGIFLTTNSGATWQPLIAGLPPGDARRIYAAEIDSTGLGKTHFRVIIGTADGVYALQTDQFGGAWQAIKRNDLPIRGVIAGGTLVYDQYDSVKAEHRFDFFIASNGSEFDHAPKPYSALHGLFKISSRYGTIIPIISAFPPPVTRVFDKLCNINAIFVPFRSNKLKIYLGTTHGIFISMDGGVSWERRSSGIRQIEMRNLISMSKKSLNDTNLFAAGYGGGMLRSTDDGMSWTESNTGLTNPFATAVAVDEQRSFLYAGTAYTLYRSTDIGKTWQSIFTVDSSSVVEPAWWRTNENDMTVRVSPVNSDIIMFRTRAYGLHISINGGLTWSRIQLPAGNDSIHVPENIVFDPSNISTIYYTGKGVFKSTNRGNTWSDISSDLPKSAVMGALGPPTGLEVFSPTIHPKNNNEMLVATVFGELGGSPYKVYKTTNGGGSWNPVDSSLRAYDIQYDILDANRIITTGPGGIFLSTNGGGSWTQQSGPLPGSSYYLIDRHAIDENVFYVGSGSGAYTLALPDRPHLTVDSTELQFGTVRIGETSNRTIVLNNATGKRNVLVRFIALTDTVSYRYNGTMEYDIPAGGETSFALQFRPVSGGFRKAVLRMVTTDDVLDTLRILLNGHAYVRPAIEKFTYDFGAVTVGKDSVMSIDIDNQFGVTSLSMQYLGQTDTSVFRYIGAADIPVDTGVTASLRFRFRPRSAGVFQSAAYFSTGDAALPVAQFAMHGTGVVRNIFKRTVLIDTSVNFIGDNGAPLSQYYSFLIRSLGRASIDVHPAKTNAASSYSAMLFVLPDGPPPRDLIDSLQQYILNGGTVVIAGDHGGRNNASFNTVLHDSTWARYNIRTGLRFNSDRIIDAGVTDPLRFGTAIAYPFRQSTLTNNVDSVVLFASGSLSVDSTLSNVVPLLVARSQQLVSVDPADSSSRSIASAIVAAVSRIGSGKIVAIADLDIWWNGLPEDSLRRFGLFAGKNLQFALNMFGSTDNYRAALPEPTPQEEYKLISIPYSFRDSSVTALFKDLGPPNDLLWRMFGRWNDNSGYAEFPNGFKTVRRGEGYWLITKQSYDVTFGNTEVQGSEEDFGITLQPGYNMIGNPFPYSVSWAESFREDSTVEKVLWKFNGGFDTTTQVMEPFKGYFVRNRSTQSKRIRINSSPVDPSLRLFKGSSGAFVDGPNGWRMQLTAASPHADDRQNFVGMIENGTDGLDNEDFSEPPLSPSDYLSLSFVQSGGRLSADYRAIDPAGAGWDLEVISSKPDFPLTLKLSKFSEIPNNFKIFLLDIVKERAYDITETMTYSTNFGKKEYRRNFRLLIGTEEFIGSKTDGIPLIPIEYALFQNYPNPFNPKTTIRFSLAHSGQTSLEVFNLLGQKVKTVAEGNYGIGQYSADWDGTDDLRQPVSSGIYYYRLITPSFSAVRKMILVK
jgi:photosystem II stability/assembly factor-like uncharacterized protein